MTQVPDVRVRRAAPADAPAIGAVFDAAVRSGWAYLGGRAREQMFGPEDWDQLVADHEPPNVLLVAVDQQVRILGYSAAHPADGRDVPAVRRPGRRGAWCRPPAPGRCA